MVIFNSYVKLPEGKSDVQYHVCLGVPYPLKTLSILLKTESDPFACQGNGTNIMMRISADSGEKKMFHGRLNVDYIM
jgi:hypothetical protein